MTAILYEHPLNERIRNYLKLEQLFSQTVGCLAYDVTTTHNVYFNALFAIIDTLDRNDIRGDLIKDMEKLEQNLVIWSQAPDIDSTALDANLQKAVALICQLKSTKPQWTQLKDDKFLSGLKQRFAIQGGNCTFDLPQLQFWLSQPQQQLINEMAYWLTLLDQIKDALSLILKFIRQRGQFTKINTESGFYQDNGEGLLLLRIKVPEGTEHYPMVSGNKFRYSIRFMLPCEDSGRRYSNQSTSFELSRC
jgi:cell division protein ZapD